MKVHLRLRKQTKNGTISQYLEYYLGTSKNIDGTHKVKREYEYLNLPLIDKPKLSEAEKQQNKKNKELAEKILAERINSINHNDYGFIQNNQSKLSFNDYYKDFVYTHKNSSATYVNAYKSFVKFSNNNEIKFKDIDFNLIKEYVYYLSNNHTSRIKFNANIKPLTVKNYILVLKMVLKKAQSENLISNFVSIKQQIENNITFPKIQDFERQYLTLDEIKLLSKSYLKNESLKRAFLFSCLTGLRISDIRKMKWSEIQQDGNEYKYVFFSQKTKKLVHLNLTNQAIEILGNKANNDEFVFNQSAISVFQNKTIKKWVLSNGINKNITFHCARHTFATLQLTLGTDITVLSKILAHSNILTTMIYAKIIDERKAEAMNKIPDLGITF